jgi:hypothetical protein
MKKTFTVEDYVFALGRACAQIPMQRIPVELDPLEVSQAIISCILGLQDDLAIRDRQNDHLQKVVALYNKGDTKAAEELLKREPLPF